MSDDTTGGPGADCPECEGRGVIIEEYETPSCPHCIGTGKVREAIHWRNLPAPAPPEEEIAAAWDATIPGAVHGIGSRLFGLTNPWDSLYEREQARLTGFVHALLSGTGSTEAE